MASLPTDDGLIAPVEATLALSHLDRVSDGTRARELYKYYQPDAPINTEACFVASPAESTSERTDAVRDLKVNSSVTSSKVSSPDTALTAFCQLTTWRTGAQRAMISVIDAETQYFIAESTRTVDLNDINKHAPGDGIWMGCSSVTKAGRLCERTIAVTPTSSGEYPCFIVNDLTKDERFSELPFVTGSPYLRFYAGVPLITKRGIPIGSLFVVDDRVANEWDREKVHFMATMAQTIMRHLEMTREVEEHRRGMKMSRGLASFVEGRTQLVEANIEPADNTEGSKIAGQFEDVDIRTIRSTRSARDSLISSTKSVIGVERKEEEYSAALSKTEEALLALSRNSEVPEAPVRPDLELSSEPNSFGATSVDVSSPRGTIELSTSTPGDDLSESTSMKMLFSRAANLIREAFEVDGGAVFYDAQTGFSSDMGARKSSTALRAMAFREDLFNDSPGDSLASDTDYITSGDHASEDGDAISPPELPPAGTCSPSLGEGRFTRTTIDKKKTAEIFGFSTAEASSMHGDPLPGPASFSALGEKALVTLLKRYPRGKLWTFDSDGAVSSSSEEELLSQATEPKFQRNHESKRRRLRSAKTKSDAKFLVKHFPGVRQLLFVPLWDAARSRWLSGCFAWSTEPTRVYSKQSELAFLTAFGNSVMAEWSRIDTEIADQKKGDFIGSISHELRSPLHGILASAEFLSEMADGRSQQLVHTIDSCGRTLLDTINHILDYSKINHFERNWRKSRRSGAIPVPGANSGSLALRQSDLPMLNLFQDINLSVLCEEVVDSVFAGSVYQNLTAQSFDMVSVQGKMSDARSEELTRSQQTQHAGVSVILDIDLQNYLFITQPGALRRLIMNLLGNALKYTSHGYVRISLEAKEMEDMHSPGSGNDGVARSQVTLTITDTGKGISPEFLRSKLFMPFAQENSLSSGTGLGLSIVRKIVALLEGEITIDSEVGRGTQVQVKLPLLREMPKTSDSTNSSGSKSAVFMPRDVDESITLVRARAAGRKVALYGFEATSKDPVLRSMSDVLRKSVTNFLVNWYGLNIVAIDRSPDFVVCNESSPTLLRGLFQRIGPSLKKKPCVIVLCSHNSRSDLAPDLKDLMGDLSHVSKPVGPLKLAKTMLQCLDGATSLPTAGVAESSPSEGTDLTTVFEELTLSPRGGEVLDNTRMSADSENARKALETPTPGAVVEKEPEFPFPTLTENTSQATNTQHGRRASREICLDSPAKITSSMLGKIVPSKKKEVALGSGHKVKFPTLLVVDDNHINLSLLSTYLNRRKYEIVHEAQHGLDAVQQFEKRLDGYDIIFMDITMPILDGFGATRQIRAMEERRRRASVATIDDPDMPRGPALIIAFTGRSSIEDQTEAVRSGIDLFMTKPVAFKEVGKIIDNWLANKEREAKVNADGVGGAGDVAKT